MNTFENFLEMVNKKTKASMKATVELMGQELAREICEEVKTLEPSQFELRKELNKQRIQALGLVLIQGGKSE